MIRLFFAIIATLTPAEHFSAHGIKALPTDLPSCDGAERLLQDHFHVELQGRTAIVNATTWDVTYRSPDYLELEYLADPDAFTHLRMIFHGDRGELQLTGITAARAPCADRVLLRVR